jgi:hypothetical protein
MVRAGVTLFGTILRRGMALVIVIRVPHVAVKFLFAVIDPIGFEPVPDLATTVGIRDKILVAVNAVLRSLTPC